MNQDCAVFERELSKAKAQVMTDGLADDVAATVVIDLMRPRIADQMRPQHSGSRHRVYVRPACWLTDKEFLGVVSSFPPLDFPYMWLSPVVCKLDPLQGWIVAGHTPATPRLVAVQLFVAQESARAYAAAGGVA